MHGLVFETSIYQLAESTRYVTNQIVEPYNPQQTAADIQKTSAARPEAHNRLIRKLSRKRVQSSQRYFQ